MNKIIINVGRQIGSGGHIIAEKLAEDFGCKCYDRELLNLACPKTQVEDGLRRLKESVEAYQKRYAG